MLPVPFSRASLGLRLCHQLKGCPPANLSLVRYCGLRNTLGALSARRLLPLLSLSPVGEACKQANQSRRELAAQLPPQLANRWSGQWRGCVGDRENCLHLPTVVYSQCPRNGQ